MATAKIIALELSKAFVLYRQPRPEAAEFELLVRTWSDVLGGVGDDELRAGMRAVMRESRYFPTPADLMRAVESARRSGTRQPVEALPQDTMGWDERCELGASRGREILDMLREKMGNREWQ